MPPLMREHGTMPRAALSIEGGLSPLARTSAFNARFSQISARRAQKSDQSCHICAAMSLKLNFILRLPFPSSQFTKAANVFKTRENASFLLVQVLEQRGLNCLVLVSLKREAVAL